MSDYPFDPRFPFAPGYTDEEQAALLGRLPGDERPTHRNLNHPWGKVDKLTTAQPRLTFVQTDVFPMPTPIVIQARFSLDGVTYTPEVPLAWAGNPVQVTLIKSFHVKSGAATEVVSLDAGDAMPFCSIIARALTVSVEISSETTQDLYVQLVAAPTTAIDCGDVVPPTPAPTTSTPARFTVGEDDVQRYPAVTANTYNIPANALRGYLVIINQSAANLYVLLGSDVSIDPGNERATIILPPDADGGYEVLNYSGEVTLKFDDDDDDGFAMSTQGSYAP